jgi:microcystin-dependent protein
MSSPYLGEIRIFPYNFAPRGWWFCNGQILAIQQYTALFSLLGTYYGGNGTSTFALPNLQGRVPLHAGQGPGLSLYQLGEETGEVSHTLLTSEVPAHNHSFHAAAGGKSDSTTVANNSPASTATGVNVYSSAAGNATMNASMLSPVGSGLPHENQQPYLAVGYAIAYQGIYPVRS